MTRSEYELMASKILALGKAKQKLRVLFCFPLAYSYL